MRRDTELRWAVPLAAVFLSLGPLACGVEAGGSEVGPGGGAGLRDAGRRVLRVEAPTLATPVRVVDPGVVPREVAAAEPERPAKRARVLFVGNSYTNANDLPELVAALGEEAERVEEVDVDLVWKGGGALGDHVESTGALERIEEGGFTHVVIQGQSVEPVWNPESFHDDAVTLARAARAAGAEPVLYETWARRAGHFLYEEPRTGGSPEAMQVALRIAYAEVAEEADAEVAPVGDAWRAVLDDHPEAPLFRRDGSHPTEHGTYLSALVLFATITGASVHGLETRPPEVGESDASTLRRVVSRLVD